MICPCFGNGRILGWKKMSMVGAGCESLGMGSGPRESQASKNALGEREGGEITDLAADSPDALVVAAQP